MTGGFGEDEVDGGNGNDLVRGDSTGDFLRDTGSVGVNTVSFATAASPGFKGAVGYGGFPADANDEERGVSINLNGTGCPGFQACNNSAIFGGGNDTIESGAFENVIGSPFADLIQGSNVASQSRIHERQQPGQVQNRRHLGQLQPEWRRDDETLLLPGHRSHLHPAEEARLDPAGRCRR